MKSDKKKITNYRKYFFSGHLEPELKGIRWKLTNLLFSRAEIDEEGKNIINEYSEKGALVFASHESSNFSLLMLQSTLNRSGLTPINYALEFNPFILQKYRYMWNRVRFWIKRSIFRFRYPDVFETDYLETIIQKKGKILFSMLSRKFFLKRYVESRYDSILYFVELQKRTDIPIYFVPEMIFWNRNPEKTYGFVPTPPATGNRFIFLNLISTTTPSYIKLLRPISIKDELETNPALNAEEIASRIRNNILEMFQKQKRIVLGPVLRSRNEIAEKVLYHRNVLNAIEEISRENNIPVGKLKNRAYRYFREIAADFQVIYIALAEYVFDIVFKKLFTGIDIDQDSLIKIREAAEKGPLVLTPCHKSHMDYMILSYLFYKHRITPPHVAAGVNLSFFPVGTFFRHSGAFFLRRSFKGLKLYTVVFKQYLKTLVADSYPLEFFVEGGRTRTGRLVFPKMGIINFLLEAIDEGYNHDLVFLPISINYDRVPEEKSYMKEMKGKEKKKETVGSVIKGGSMLSKDHGKVYVSIGDYFTLKDVEREGITGTDRIPEIGFRIINGIYNATSITPVSMVATPMLMMAIRGFTKKGLMRNMILLHEYFSFNNAFFSSTTREKKELLNIGEYVLNVLLHDKLIEHLRYDDRESAEDFFLIKEESRPGLSFYKNSVSHFMLDISLISVSILTMRYGNACISIDAVKEKMEFMMGLIDREYVYAPKYKDLNSLIHSVIHDFMISKNILTQSKEGCYQISEENQSDLVFFARAIQDIIESYLIVFDRVSTMRDSAINNKELIADIRKHGIALYHSDRIRASESLSNPNYSNAVKKLCDLGFMEEVANAKKNHDYRLKDRESVKQLKDKLEQFSNALK